MNEKTLHPLPAPKFTETIRGVPCITVTEHEHLMRTYALQAIAHAEQSAEVTDEFLYELWDEKFRSWIGGEQFESIARAILALRPVQVPMTPQQALDSIGGADWANWWPAYIAGIRAAEAHHGITAQDKKEGV